MNLRRALLGSICCVLLLASCSIEKQPLTLNDGLDGSGPPAFELRLASAKLIAGWTEMQVRGGGSLIVSPKAILLPSQVRNAAISKNDSDALILNVRMGSRETLQAYTSEHMFKPIVFLIKGKAVYMAVLGMPLNRQVSIRIGPDGITEAEAKFCLDSVKQSVK